MYSIKKINIVFIIIGFIVLAKYIFFKLKFNYYHSSITKTMFSQ